MSSSPVTFFACSAAALLFTTGGVRGVPLNDDIANVAVLSPGLTDEINNTGATLEAGEQIPDGFTSSNYQATAWWSFAPAFQDGWYEIETTGSAVNTVLAVWTGDDYTSPLTLLHVNDEATEGGVSRIRMHLDFAEYKISVASRTAARGTVKLKATAIVDPFAVVTGASFAPATPNVGGAAATVVATIDIQATREIDSGQFTLFSPSGSVLSTASVSGAGNRRAGTSIFMGTYDIPFTIPANSTPGACKWSISVHHDNASNPASVPDSSYGWEAMTPLPDNAPTTISVIRDSYARWLAAYSMSGAASARAADYDLDGVKNLIEFAFGMDPRSGDQGALVLSGSSIVRAGMPVVTTVGSGDQQRLRIEFIRRLNDPSITYTVKFSDDLVNWTNATNAPSVIGSSLGFEAVAVEDSVFIPAKTRRYAHVSITQ